MLPCLQLINPNPLASHTYYIMSAFIHFELLGNNFLLSNDRCIYWEEKKILIASDLHLGKTGHFRKSGIGVPQTIFSEDMQRLVAQLQYFKPHQLLVIGDLFHSTANKEHELFLKWRKDLSGINICLVQGNHDILDESWYEEAGIDLQKKQVDISSFTFTHDISEADTNGTQYYFSGHIHPGIIISGMGKQSLRFPCFYFSKKFAVLPAFGKFTGTYPVDPKPGDHVFALVEKKIMKIM